MIYYGTLAALIESLTEAKAAGNLSRRLRVLTHPALLVVDEIGYMPVNQDGAVLFFQIINARHERASTVLTSNKGFEDWGGVLGDEVMAAALIDRLVHHCHIVNIRGNSYRMKDHQNLLQSGSDRRRRESLETCVDDPLVVQVLRLLESFRLAEAEAAIGDALKLGAIGFDAVKHLVLCRIERRPPRLDLDVYPYLPKARVATTSARSYMRLLPGAGT